jgi:hypothetical protein
MTLTTAVKGRIAQEVGATARVSAILRRVKPRLLIVAFLLVTWLALWHFWPIDAIHFDSSRDLLISRDCYDLGRCDGHGPPTSFRGLYQGVLWNNALGLFRQLGASPKGIGIGIAGLYACIIVASARWAKGRNPSALWLLLVAGSLASTPVVLWSPTLFFPAMMLTTWLTLEWLEEPGWPLALGLGLLWGVTLDLYLAGGPVLLATIALGVRARKPLQALAILGLALLVGLAISPGAWTGTLAFIPDHPLRVLVVLLAFAAMLWVAVRLPKLDAVWLLALTGTGAWLIIGLTRTFQWRYLMPGFPALALLIAQRLPAKAAQRLGIMAIVAALAFCQAHPQRALSYSNVEALAEAMQQHAIGWPQALTHAQGEFSRQLARPSVIFLPYGETPWRGEDVVVDLKATKRFHAVPSRIDLADAELCRKAAGPQQCEPLNLDPTPPDSIFPMAAAVYAAIIPELPLEVTALTLRVSIRAGAPETLTLLPQLPGDTACPWRFADGRTDVQLDSSATELRLERLFTRNTCPDGKATADWLPTWREAPRNPNAQPIPPPPTVKRLAQPILPHGVEARFARLAATLAAQLHEAEPDIEVRREIARVKWPNQSALELRYDERAPWFVIAQPNGDMTRQTALLQALPAAFPQSPWQDADAQALTVRLERKPAWPHLTLAALGLLVVALAGVRVARGRALSDKLSP